MKEVAAYLLTVLGGNPQPFAKDLQAILELVGVEVKDDKIKLLLTEVQGKDITELIATGREKFSSVPSSGGGGAEISVAAAGSGDGSAATPAAAESKKEEEVEEKDDSDEDMGFSLFD